NPPPRSIQCDVCEKLAAIGIVRATACKKCNCSGSNVTVPEFVALRCGSRRSATLRRHTVRMVGKGVEGRSRSNENIFRFDNAAYPHSPSCIYASPRDVLRTPPGTARLETCTLFCMDDSTMRSELSRCRRSYPVRTQAVINRTPI